MLAKSQTKLKKKDAKKAYTTPVVVTYTFDQKKALQEFASSKGLTMASFIRSESLKLVMEDANKQTKSTNKFAKFAGKLDDDTANFMLSSVAEGRVNKD